MYVCIYIYIYIYKYIYIYHAPTHARTHTHTYTQTYSHTRTCIRTLVRTHHSPHLYVCLLVTTAHISIHTYTSIEPPPVCVPLHDLSPHTYCMHTFTAIYPTFLFFLSFCYLTSVHTVVILDRS